MVFINEHISAHAETIIHLEHAYIFYEISACLRYKLKNLELYNEVVFSDMHHFCGNQPYIYINVFCAYIYLYTYIPAVR